MGTRGPLPSSSAIRLWVVSYDIADSRRRAKVAKVLEGCGQRVQFSVFQCSFNDTQLKRVRARVRRLIEEKEDKVRWYPLCRPCRHKFLAIGASPPNVDDDWFFIV